MIKVQGQPGQVVPETLPPKYPEQIRWCGSIGGVPSFASLKLLKFKSQSHQTNKKFFKVSEN
jgi:hypothetical protein